MAPLSQMDHGYCKSAIVVFGSRREAVMHEWRRENPLWRVVLGVRFWTCGVWMEDSALLLAQLVSMGFDEDGGYTFV